MVEQPAVNRFVVGSIPTWGEQYFKHKIIIICNSLKRRTADYPKVAISKVIRCNVTNLGCVVKIKTKPPNSPNEFRTTAEYWVFCICLVFCFFISLAITSF